MSVIKKIQDIFKIKPVSQADSIDTPPLATPVKSPGTDHGAEAAIGKKIKMLTTSRLLALLVRVRVQGLMLVQLILLTRPTCCACQFWEVEPPHTISEHC